MEQTSDSRLATLRILLFVDALVFLNSAALNFGATIPLGFVTLLFPRPVLPAAIGEVLIGGALLLAALTMNRSASWVALALAAVGITFGLRFSPPGSPQFAVHI